MKPRTLLTRSGVGVVVQVSKSESFIRTFAIVEGCFPIQTASVFCRLVAFGLSSGGNLPATSLFYRIELVTVEVGVPSTFKKNSGSIERDCVLVWTE